MVDEALIKKVMWESAKEIFDTMVALPLEQADHEQEQAEQDTSLICSITFMGPLQGCFLMQCHIPSAEKIARAMLMMEPTDPLDETEVSDAFGEVVNMTLGGIKSRLLDTVGEIKISIPTTIKGKEIWPKPPKTAIKTEVMAKFADNRLKLIMLCNEKKGD